MTSTPTLPQLTRGEALARIDSTYAVVVLGKAVRRHLYFGLPAVQRAAARGHTAHIALARLQVVEEVSADE